MKKFVVAGLCALTVGVIAPTQPAQAAGDRCTSKSEYRQVKTGMSKAQVTRIIGYRGKKVFDFDQYETREYESCKNESGFIWVSYERRKVTSKSATWR